MCSYLPFWFEHIVCVFLLGLILCGGCFRRVCLYSRLLMYRYSPFKFEYIEGVFLEGSILSRVCFWRV